MSPRLPIRVVFYPSLADSTNPYWPILRASLVGQGVEFEDLTEIPFSTKWLWANRGRVDVLHFHYVQQFYAFENVNARLWWVFRFARNLLLARTLGYRTVFTLHNLTPTFELRPAWTDYLGHWVAANFTNSVIVHCNFARRALARRYGRRSDVVTVNHPTFEGVYADTLTTEEAREILGLSSGQIVFSFVGGIRPNKGIERLITAFQEIPDQNLRLVIAGEASRTTEYVSRLVDLAKRDDRIRLYPDLIPDEKIQVFLRSADVVVLPFNSILTSSSTVLAMSFGKPLVAPMLGCLAELVGPSEGILYDPADPDGLRAALSQCLTSDLRKMGEAARQKVSTFTADDMANRTLTAYGR